MSEKLPDGLLPDLPRPDDDGGAEGLEGREVPTVRLDSTTGEQLDLDVIAEGTLVVYVYPGTGVPGEPLPPGWMQTPGAFGCTAENCAFRDHASQLAALGATVVGVSAQPLAEQREFAARERMPHPVLNDSGFALAEGLDLPTLCAVTGASPSSLAPAGSRRSSTRSSPQTGTQPRFSWLVSRARG